MSKGSNETVLSISQSDLDNSFYKFNDGVILENEFGIYIYKIITDQRIRLDNVISPSKREDFQVQENTQLPIKTYGNPTYLDRCYAGS